MRSAVHAGQPEREQAGPLDLAAGRVHIRYRLTESMGRSELAKAYGLLSADERSRCNRYRLASDRRDYAAAHALLRSSLSLYCKVPPHAHVFAMGPQGKPQAAGRSVGAPGRLHFTLSHASGIVCCAITMDAAVGIDVERTDLAFDYSPIATRYFSDEEIARLDRCAPEDRPARFVELWTLREAYVKATGHGLSEEMRDLSFDIEGDRVCFTAPRLPSAGHRRPRETEWHFSLFPVAPCARISVAVNCRDAPAWSIWPVP